MTLCLSADRDLRGLEGRPEARGKGQEGRWGEVGCGDDFGYIVIKPIAYCLLHVSSG